ncbi:MAG: phosphodiester glycosidase family protein [Erysipelotrichaceae bacterium]|nr:phosphodiester glycosidase family protein [Erysipelotrichaceae bacterium]
MKKIKKMMAVLCLGLASVSAHTLTAEAELVNKAWGQGYSNTFILGLNNTVGSAVNIYTLKGTEPSVIHHTGNFNGINYDMLEVTPSETTFVKLDYMGYAEWLNNIYDWGLVSEGYVRAGGINANYYSWHTNPNAGQPVGGVRVAGKWTDFRGEPNMPEYGNGYVTAYWDRTGLMKLVYSGEDVNGGGWVGEKVESECALSGSYTYIVNGERKDLTGGSGWYEYHYNDYAFSCLAQKKDGTYYLISFWNGMRDEKVQDFLLELDVYNALRLDGGTSTSMCYEEDAVQEAEPSETEDEEDLSRLLG